MAESRRQNTAIQEIDSAAEVEFSSRAVSADYAVASQASVDFSSLALLWEHRRWLRRFAVRALLASTIVALLIPNQYESSVRIMPPEAGSNASSMIAALSGKANPELVAMASSLLGMKGSGALYVDLFHTRSVQDHLVDRFNLQNVYWKRYKQDARKKLDGRTSVSEDRKSGVITLTVEDRSPQRAHDLAQAYVEELNRLLAQVSTSSARRERIFIEQRLVSVKSDLEDAEKQFSAFASKNTALDIKEQTKAMVESAAELQGQLIAAQSQLQSLEQIYTPENVRVRAMRARVDELQRQMRSLRGSDSSLLASGSPDEMYPPVRKLPLLGVEWADLYRRVKIQETVYELLNQQYELARIEEAKEIPTVNVVDSANLPEKKSFPPRALIVVLLTAISLAGASAWILGARRIHSFSENDPRRQLAIRASDSLNQIRNRISGIRLRGRNGSSEAGDGNS